MFTKRHYEAIAQEFSREMAVTKSPLVLMTMATRMAAMFRHDNPRFNRDRFMIACGVADLNIKE